MTKEHPVVPGADRRTKTPVVSLVTAGALALAACSSPADTKADVAPAGDTTATAGGPPSPATVSPVARADVLSLERLGDLVIGKPVPSGSSFAERGAQIDESCRTVSSPTYPGVYAIVENGEVRRISLGERSDLKLVEGVGVGATEAEVLKAFPGFEASPHKYVAAPGKYLTQPGDDPRLLFEIGENGRVSLIHAGLMPQLGYVEGCA